MRRVGCAAAVWCKSLAARRVADPARVTRQVAGRVERDPPVEADDHEGEERLVELARRVAAGRVAEVEPDRVGHAVAVVVDVVGDLTVAAGNQVGKGGGVVAVGGAGAEDARGRVGPVAKHGFCWVPFS